jgi:hypothetical protein
MTAFLSGGILNKTLQLRKVGSQFIESIATEGKHTAKRSFENWEKVEARLSNLGLLPEEIARVKAEFDSGKDTTSVQIP